MEEHTRRQKTPPLLPVRRASGQTERTDAAANPNANINPNPNSNINAYPITAVGKNIGKGKEKEKPEKPTIATQAASTSNIHVPAENTGIEAAGEDGNGNQQPGPGEPEAEKQAEKPITFAPFFTLVNDLGAGNGAGGGGTYHPSRIHYLFSDDDASDLLMEALVRSASTPSHSNSLELLDDSGLHISARTTSSSSSSATFRRDGSLRETPRHKIKNKANEVKVEKEERVLIVDLEPQNDTFAIQSISSLTPTWQVLSAEITNAPTWDGADPSDSVTAPGLMLKIEGMGVPVSNSGEGEVGLGIRGEEGGLRGDRGAEREKDKEKEIGEEELAALLEGFDSKMRLLRRVMGSRSRVNSRGSGRSEADG